MATLEDKVLEEELFWAALPHRGTQNRGAPTEFRKHCLLHGYFTAVLL